MGIDTGTDTEAVDADGGASADDEGCTGRAGEPTDVGELPNTASAEDAAEPGNVGGVSDTARTFSGHVQAVGCGVQARDG